MLASQAPIKDQETLASFIKETVNKTPITDMHTHLYAPAFGDLLLYGIDDLLTYHYLIAETLRHSPLTYEQFWALSQQGMANHIWDTLFIKHSPYSEACRGVLTSLQQLGLDNGSRDIEGYRRWYEQLTPEEAVDLVFKTANVKEVVMTNDPFDPAERGLWLCNAAELTRDKRFHAALRIDPLLNQWELTYKQLIDWGYQVEEQLNQTSIDEVKRFLKEWAVKMDALYMAVSLPIDFRFPAEDARQQLIEQCVLPVCQELNIPFAMMIGVKRQANPLLQLAGDMGGRADIESVEAICRKYPQNRFFVTMLSRENQHELAVLARKFRNLMVFGCWWFLNNPSIIKEMTEMRFELLGTSVIPQHSDCRILDQLIYKWSHSKEIVAEVLTQKYTDIMRTGWQLEKHEIERDIQDLLGQNFWKFVKGE